MVQYVHVEDGAIDDGPRELPRAWRNTSGLDLADTETLKELGWLPVAPVGDTFDPATQVRTGPVLVIGDDEVTATYEVRDKTAQELAAEQRAVDSSKLREAGKDVAVVLTELVDYLIANTAMQASNFTPSVRQAYQDLKVIADRVK